MKRISTSIITILGSAATGAAIALAVPAGAAPAPAAHRTCATIEATNHPIELKVCGGPVTRSGFWLCTWSPRRDTMTCPVRRA